MSNTLSPEQEKKINDILNKIITSSKGVLSKMQKVTADPQFNHSDVAKQFKKENEHGKN